MIDQKVTAQPGQPGNERAFRRAVTLQRAKHAQENVLGQILRFRVAAREPVAQPVHSPRVQPDQFLPTGGITAQAPCNERCSRDPSRVRSSPRRPPPRTGAPPRPGIGSARQGKRSLMAAVAIVYPIFFSDFHVQVTRFYDDRFIFPFRGKPVDGFPGKAASSRRSGWKWLTLGAILLLIAVYLLRSELRKSGFRWSVFVATLARLQWPWLLAAVGLALATYLRAGPPLGRAAEASPAASQHAEAVLGNRHRLHGGDPAGPPRRVRAALSDRACRSACRFLRKSPHGFSSASTTC